MGSEMCIRDRRDMVSWHSTVDDHAIVQHLPEAEMAYHAGIRSTRRYIILPRLQKCVRTAPKIQ